MIDLKSFHRFPETNTWGCTSFLHKVINHTVPSDNSTPWFLSHPKSFQIPLLFSHWIWVYFSFSSCFLLMPFHFHQPLTKLQPPVSYPYLHLLSFFCLPFFLLAAVGKNQHCFKGCKHISLSLLLPCCSPITPCMLPQSQHDQLWHSCLGGCLLLPSSSYWPHQAEAWFSFFLIFFSPTLPHSFHLVSLGSFLSHAKERGKIPKNKNSHK